MSVTGKEVLFERDSSSLKNGLVKVQDKNQTVCEVDYFLNGNLALMLNKKSG